MDRSLRRRLTLRVLLAAGLLVLAAGATAYWRGMKGIDETVLALALQEANELASHAAVLAALAPSARPQALEELASHVRSEHVARGSFVAVELYDLQRRRLLSVVDPEAAAAVAAIEAGDHAGQFADQPTARRAFHGGRMYAQVISALKGPSGEPVAWFEGIYGVAPATLRMVNGHLLGSVLAVVLAVLLTGAVLVPVLLSLQRDAVRLADDVADANLATLSALGSAVATRDRETGTHNLRVTLYAVRLAEAVGTGQAEIRGLIKGAFLHDVGKLAIADAILRKPARLTEAERRAMKQHVLRGVEIVQRHAWLHDALDVVRSHHERWDGEGYPDGLRGPEIPVAARIFAIVDVFDALTTARPYHGASDFAEALATLAEDRGKAFDPKLLDVFLDQAPALEQGPSSWGEERLQEAVDALLRRYFGPDRSWVPPAGERPAAAEA